MATQIDRGYLPPEIPAAAIPDPKAVRGREWLYRQVERIHIDDEGAR
jgi:hypothetical protein